MSEGSMTLDPSIMKAVEALDYRVTVGDVASQAGIDVRLAEQGLLALASDAGGHMQVSESGDIAYLFPRNFRSVLQNKYFRLQLLAWWGRIWKILFYLIRISFGIVLIASILLITIAITLLLVAMSSSRNGDGDRNDSGGGGMIFFPRFLFSPDFFYVFYPDFGGSSRSQRRRRMPDDEPQMSFLEAVFSFLFGDGNPNATLDEKRWRAIATVIRKNGGAIAAEQITPYLDNIQTRFDEGDEDYMLPVLIRFNGRPEVSPDGQIIYHFPELQVTAQQSSSRSVPAYLKELLWRFSDATVGQRTLAAGLGVVNLAGAIALGLLLRDGTIAAYVGTAGGILAFVNGIYGLLLAYGIGFLTIPLVRWLWLKRRNRGIEARNEERQQRAEAVNQAPPEIQQKIAYARQFAATTVIDERDLAYTTEHDLTEQEALNADKIDEEWRRRLEQSNPS